MTQQDWLSTYFSDDVAEDLEKTAQAHLLVKLAEANGIDINQLSEEQLQALAADIMAGLEAQGGGQPGPGVPLQPGQPGFDMNPTQPGHGIQPQGAPQMRQAPGMGAMQGQPPAPMGAPGGGVTPEMAKEAQAKFEEADALGRVMAHAYVEELDKIASQRGGSEKTAGSRLDRAGAAAREVAGKARNFAKSNNGRVAGAGAAGLGVGGSVGNAIGRRQGREKTASSVAFEKLAQDRAAEVLQTIGIDPSTGQPFQQQQQSPQVPQGNEEGQQPDFNQALDSRALQILSEAGYDPQQVVSAYDQVTGAQ